jgi:hypothetical protein
MKGENKDEREAKPWSWNILKLQPDSSETDASWTNILDGGMYYDLFYFIYFKCINLSL